MSPRLRTSFEKNIKLVYLADLPTAARSPNQKDHIEDILLRLLDCKSDGELKGEIAQHISFLNDKFQPKAHAECLIVLNALVNEPKLPHCNYIGVSKLACFGCESFFRNFNEVYKTNWVTSGGHHKIYPWGILPGAMQKAPNLSQILRGVHSDLRKALHKRALVAFGPRHNPTSGTFDFSTIPEDERWWDIDYTPGEGVHAWTLDEEW